MVSVSVSRLRRVFLLSLVLAAALLGLGCAAISQPFGHLAGTHDARLEYAIGSDPVSGRAVPADVAAPGVKARLAAAGIPADVEAGDDERIRVTVDGDVAGVVDDLVTWIARSLDVSR